MCAWTTPNSIVVFLNAAFPFQLSSWLSVKHHSIPRNHSQAILWGGGHYPWLSVSPPFIVGTGIGHAEDFVSHHHSSLGVFLSILFYTIPLLSSRWTVWRIDGPRLSACTKRCYRTPCCQLIARTSICQDRCSSALLHHSAWLPIKHLNTVRNTSSHDGRRNYGWIKSREKV